MLSRQGITVPTKVENRRRGRALGVAKLYGRKDERAALGALLERARQAQSGALILRGPAGIGKSALIADTVVRAKGFRIIAAEGAESESGTVLDSAGLSPHSGRNAFQEAALCLLPL